MSFKFRPMLSALEGREVPASLSFALSDGTTASGSFATPAEVDPTQASQAVELADLNLVRGGVTYTPAPVPMAYYSYGSLTAVVANLFGPDDQIDLYLNGTALVTPYGSSTSATGTIAYDPADAQVTFALPGGTVGSISYQIPWAQVDPSQSSQSLTPTAFTINIAGQNIVSGFTTAPTLTFNNGNLTGANFALGAVAGVGYSSLSMAGLAVTAVQAATGDPLFATAAANGPGSIIANFKNFTPPNQAAGEVEVSFLIKLSDTNEINVKVKVNSNTTIAGLRALFKTALKNDWNFTAEDIGTTELQFHGKPGQEIKSIKFFGFGNSGLGVPVPGGTSPNKDGSSPEWITPTN